MIETLVMALGFLLVFEGLLYAFLPGHLRRMAATILGLPDAQLRSIGLFAIGVGVVVIWAVRVFLQN
jgi:uncharacterized protein